MGASSAVRTGESGRREPRRIAVEELGSHLATLEAELSDGRAIELMRGEKLIAEVRAPGGAQAAVEAAPDRPAMPDFMAMLREIYGDKPLDVDTTEWIREGRE
jgi:hypothetical protein